MQNETGELKQEIVVKYFIVFFNVVYNTYIGSRVIKEVEKQQSIKITCAHCQGEETNSETSKIITRISRNNNRVILAKTNSEMSNRN